ncbi:unnamed protein product [Fusarium graminearum]|uniref:Uncharacterized protein n=1 Tax=Gibberella zeae TaxID=5518 RepID=A0A9N8WYR6_GIBZA|nr:unnamed protein product [Fusarium graminearum]
MLVPILVPLGPLLRSLELLSIIYINIGAYCRLTRKEKDNIRPFYVRASWGLYFRYAYRLSLVYGLILSIEGIPASRGAPILGGIVALSCCFYHKGEVQRQGVG